MFWLWVLIVTSDGTIQFDVPYSNEIACEIAMVQEFPEMMKEHPAATIVLQCQPERQPELLPPSKWSKPSIKT